jgi:hypothetical protein
MKPCLIGVYLVLVVSGALAIAVRSSRRFYFTATRHLPQNHRVLASDLRAPESAWALSPSPPEDSKYAGRYLVREMWPQEEIKPEYLKSHPVLKPASGTTAYAWLLPDADKGWLQVVDAGWTVDLCAEKCPVIGAPLLAWDCASPDEGPCAAVIQVTPDQEARLVEYPNKNKLRLAVSRVDLGENK